MKVKFLFLTLLFLSAKPADAISLQSLKAAGCAMLGVGSAGWGLLNACAVVAICPRGIACYDELYDHMGDLLRFSSIAVASSIVSACCLSKARALWKERNKAAEDAWYKEYGIERKRATLAEENTLLEKEIALVKNTDQKTIIYTASSGLAAISALWALMVYFNIEDETWRSAGYRKCRLIAANSALLAFIGLLIPKYS